MSDPSRFERRVAALVTAYAELAPVAVDPRAMTDLVAAERRGGVWARRPDRRLGLAFVGVALLGAAVGGALVGGGRPVQRPPEDLLPRDVLVEPFAGLPPVGAVPTGPATGELVLAFDGRVRTIGGRFHRVWLFEDGRLIWTQEGGSTGVIEQRLAPQGVQMLRAEVMATARLGQAIDPAGYGVDGWDRPGVIWGGLRVAVGSQVFQAGWQDADLPGRLEDPASWLPASAWIDARVGAYVPTRYAVCTEDFDVPGETAAEQARLLDSLPDASKDVIRTRATELGGPTQDRRCRFQVSLGDARALIATLGEAGLRAEQGSPLRYGLPAGRAGSEHAMVELLPIVPSGEVVCNCG